MACLLFHESLGFVIFCEHVHEDFSHDVCGAYELDDGCCHDDAMSLVSKGSNVLEPVLCPNSRVPLTSSMPTSGSSRDFSDLDVLRPSPSALPSQPLLDHVVHPQEPDHQAQRARRGAFSGVDGASIEDSIDRVPRCGEVGGGQDSEWRARAPQSGGQEEASTDRLLEGVHRQRPGEEDHPPACGLGNRSGDHQVPAARLRESGLRQDREPHVPGAVSEPPKLLLVDCHDQSRGRQSALAAHEAGRVAPGHAECEVRGFESRAGRGEVGEAGSRSQRCEAWSSSIPSGTGEPDTEVSSHGILQQPEGQCGPDRARPAGDGDDEDPRARGGEGATRDGGEGERSSRVEEPPGDVEIMLMEDECLECSKLQSCHSGHKFLSHQWREDRNPYSESFQALVGAQRTFLIEVACSKDSLLSAEVQKRLGPDAAIRCSHENGYDLTSRDGVRRLCSLVASQRPLHVWISCECGPYSPFQRINQRTPEQCNRLEEKRRQARQQYDGGIQVAKFAKLCGAHVHFELSERCEAWKLPSIEKFVKDLSLKRVTCNGCTVGLRVGDNQQLSCKGWNVATSSDSMVQHLHLPCQRNHRTASLEGGNKAHSTASYTPVFVKKVVEAMNRQEPWSLIAQELSSVPEPQADKVPPSNDGDIFAGENAMPEAEKQRILKLIKHIHSVSGHGSVHTLVQALAKRGVPEHVLKIARQFKCPICEERVRTAPRRPATLMTIPKKWQVLQTDVGTWTHPYTRLKYKFVLFIDEGCRFRTGSILFQDQNRQASWEVIRKSMEEHWLAHFGQPDMIRVDADGAWRNEEADRYCNSRGIQLDFVPAEAHWQIGIVESAIKSTKAVMQALCEEFKDMSIEECFARALWACNSRDNPCGYSPLQHATGRAPDEWGRLFDSKVSGFPIHSQEMIDAGFGANIKAMSLAEQAFLKDQAQQRLARAEAAGKRPLVPGDLVFYWRRQVAGREKERGFTIGSFVGPARVLAVETRVDDEGRLRPGSCVWLHRAGRLIKAAPEQLRAATDRERAIEELKGPVEIPWTITSLASHPHKKTYDDITSEIPDDMQWDEAAQQPVLSHRIRGKKRPHEQPPEGRPPEPRGSDEAMKAVVEGSPKRSGVSDVCFEIEIEFPESKRGIKKFLQNPEAFVVSQLKRKQVEVHERNLSPQERAQFREAKMKEVRSFISAQCFELVPKHLQPDPASGVGMRWVLTWKEAGDSSDPKRRKAKARAAVLGYQDDQYEYRQTSSPTVSRTGRQAFLQLCAWRKFGITKGDVSAAFLQGELLEDDYWIRPVPEIYEELKVEPGELLKLKRAAYGLVQAPLHWYKSVCSYLQGLGYTRMKGDPCVWVYHDSSGVLRSCICAHVDDFLFGGAPGDKVHDHLMEQIKQHFSWGSWESSSFTQCGVTVTQHSDFSITLDQQEFVSDLQEIKLSRDRSRQVTAETSDYEKHQLRAVLGALSWFTGQTGFQFSSDVGILLSSVSTSQVETILRTNKLIRDVKDNPGELRIHAFPDAKRLELVCWADAAWANRPDGKSSTEGIVIGFSSPALLEGKIAPVSLMYWRSGKIDRTCRSPACAETKGVVNGEDDLYHLRYLWSEMLLPKERLVGCHPDTVVVNASGTLVTDSKNLWDKLSKEIFVIKGAEKRSDLEALSLKESQDNSQLQLRWVHSDAMLANSLTKPSEKWQILLFQKMKYHWRIVHDSNMVSARKRKAEGIDPMHSEVKG